MLTGFHLPPPTAAIAVALIAALGLAPSWAMTGAASPALEWQPPEPLSAGLATGRVQAEDLPGREVFAYDEMWLGTFRALGGRVGGAVDGIIALDSRLGLGGGCIAAPLALILEAPERRLVLIFSPDELRKAAEADLPCGS